MHIILTSGTGKGPTPLAAFDAALLQSGVHNYNLISLSSVIPPGSVIERARFYAPLEEYGHRLYVVMAHQEVKERGKEAWAGLGWVQERDGDGRGLFVESHGDSEAEVRETIKLSLASLMETRGLEYGPIQCELAGATCEDKPVCALVMAVYKAMGWD